MWKKQLTNKRVNFGGHEILVNRMQCAEFIQLFQY